MSKVEDV